MTNRLYYTDSYLCDFEASIVDHGEGGKRIYLDQTAFYPASGGQPSDTGLLGGIEVLEVAHDGDRVAHLMAAPLSGSRVIGKINWPRRFDHMQQHTGQHLLSAVAADLLGRRTAAVHLGKETSTVDLEGGALDAEQVAQVEERANQIITENRPVRVDFENAMAAQGLRKPSEREGTIRVVTILDLDRSACGGTHVRATGEIGSIAIRKVERMRSGMRLEFVCGGRAVRHARADHQLLNRLAGELTAAPTDLPEVIQRARVELKEIRAAQQELQKELDTYRARELYAAIVPDEDGLRRIFHQDPSGSMDRLRGLALAVTTLSKVLFVGSTGQPPGLIVATSKDSELDAAQLMKIHLPGLGGRGGGSAKLAQGVLPGPDQVKTLIALVMAPGVSR